MWKVVMSVPMTDAEIQRIEAGSYFWMPAIMDRIREKYGADGLSIRWSWLWLSAGEWLMLQYLGD